MKNKIVKQKIMVNHYRYHDGSFVKTEETEVIKTSEMETFKTWLKDLPTSTKSLVKGQKVMFDKNVIFPRRKFQKAYPGNKIVNNVKDADVIVIDKDTLKKKYAGWYWSAEYNECTNGHWFISGYYPIAMIKKTTATTGVTEHFITMNPGVEAIIKKINDLYDLDGRNVMDVQDLHLPSEEHLTVDSYERISKMLGGSDDSMRTVAMNMLTAYNYQEESKKIAILVNFHWSKWMNMRVKKENVEIKSMLRKLSVDFPTMQQGVNSPRFWLQIGLDAKGDEVMEKAFNLWVKTVYPEAPVIKVMEVSE